MKDMDASGFSTEKDIDWAAVRSRLVSLWPDIKDTAGAGDWCSAGIIDKLGRNGNIGFQNIEKGHIEYALKFGQALSIINCQFFGARGAMYQISKENIVDYVKQIIENTTKGKTLLTGD